MSVHCVLFEVAASQRHVHPLEIVYRLSYPLTSSRTCDVEITTHGLWASLCIRVKGSPLNATLERLRSSRHLIDPK
jgi:hypothetical protein